ncbi:YciI family protein [Priestia megaterium]
MVKCFKDSKKWGRIYVFVLVNYVKPIEVVEEFLESHVTFLDKYYEQKKFIISGRRNPRTGGAILVNSTSKDEVEKIVSEDPFL